MSANVKDIVSSLKDNSLVLFVGAGVSMSSGLKSWKQLTGDLLKDLQRDAKDYEPTTIAEFFDIKRGRTVLKNQVKKSLKFETDDKDHLIAQKEICSWPVDTIITTNFDYLLEDACKENKKEPEIFLMNDLSGWNYSQGLRIFKMHGQIESDIILTERDFQDYESNYPGAFHTLLTLFYTRPILFLGCSLKDPNFRKVFHRVRNILSKNKSNNQIKHFALMSKMQEDEKRMWGDFGINVITYNNSKKENNEAFYNVLRDISDRCLSSARTINERTKVFENYERYYLSSSELMESLTIRKETTASFFAIPKNDPDIFQDADEEPKLRAKFADRKRETYEKYIKNGVLVKLIISVNPSRLEDRGYTGNRKLKRLKTLYKFINNRMDKNNFQVVNRTSCIEHFNISIYNEDWIVENMPIRKPKSHTVKIDVLLNPNIISHRKEMFDERFCEFMKLNLKESGLSDEEITSLTNKEKVKITKQFILNEIKKEIAENKTNKKS